MVATVTAPIHSLMRSWCGAISGHVVWRRDGSTSSGNQPSASWRPLLGTERRPARDDAGLDRRLDVLAHGLRVHAERRAQLADRGARRASA